MVLNLEEWSPCVGTKKNCKFITVGTSWNISCLEPVADLAIKEKAIMWWWWWSWSSWWWWAALYDDHPFCCIKNSIHNDLVVKPIHRAASGVPFHDVLHEVSFGHENGAHLLTSVGLLLGTMYHTDTLMNF